MKLSSLIILLCITSSMSAFCAEDSNWTIASRTIPAPAGVSEVLYNSIANTPQPNVEESSTHPDNAAAWETFISSTANVIPIQVIEQALNLQIEQTDIANVKIYRVTPQEIAAKHEDHLFLYTHGGAYVFNAGDASVSESALVASMAGMKAISIDYRMPPSDPFPAAVDDVVAVYLELLNTYDADNIVIGGSSAGAGLAMAAIHKLKEQGAALPAALYAGSPWADLTKTSDTLFTNEGLDRILVTYEGYLKGAAELYAGSNDLKNPLISPIYGDFAEFPPTILVSGTRDLFLSDTVRTHRKLRSAGVNADLHVYEAMSHTGYGFMRQAPESADFYGELIRFIDQHLD